MRQAYLMFQAQLFYHRLVCTQVIADYRLHSQLLHKPTQPVNKARAVLLHQQVYAHQPAAAGVHHEPGHYLLAIQLQHRLVRSHNLYTLPHPATERPNRADSRFLYISQLLILANSHPAQSASVPQTCATVPAPNSAPPLPSRACSARVRPSPKGKRLTVLPQSAHLNLTAVTRLM